MKILKRLRVTPVSPVFVLGVELSMYIVYCIVSLVTLSLVALLWGVRLHGSLLAFLGSWALTMISTLSVGMLAGGVAKDSKQASVIASILYFPMLVFSADAGAYDDEKHIFRCQHGKYSVTALCNDWSYHTLHRSRRSLLPMGIRGHIKPIE